MAQQTAVEWLEHEINRRGPKENNPPQWLHELYQAAKQMEREQIEKAHNEGKNILPPNENGEQYYTQTYGTRLQNETN